MTRSLPLIRFPPHASVYRFGTPTSAPPSAALLRFPAQGWTVAGPSTQREGWAIVGDAEGRRNVVETLLGRHRIQPIAPPPGPFPYISSLTAHAATNTTIDPGDGQVAASKPVRHLAFARPPVTGEFTDFTARYGALQEEDKMSFRQTLSSLSPPPSEGDIETVARAMNIHHLLDLPSVSLSSGQTRRARIAAALLTKPVLLLLEDPMAGLDIPSRKQVSQILGDMNSAGERRIMLVLRGKGSDALPEWITDVCAVKQGDVWIGSRSDWEDRAGESSDGTSTNAHRRPTTTPRSDEDAPPVVELQDVSISYGEGTRQVLKNISWTIRPGDKWHLKGANGSGKTTLLSLILGHHPRSFSLPSDSLRLFSKPRRQIPTPILRTMIGHTSPEIYASFPRGMGLSAVEAVGSGFEGIFSRRQLSSEQKSRVVYLLEHFLPMLQSTRPGLAKDVTAGEIAKRQFAHFTPPQQALMLFLRAIVARPPLLILDEPSQGMDEAIWTRCRELLVREWEEMPDQAVIVVSHYDDEVPWAPRRESVLELVEGKATTS